MPLFLNSQQSQADEEQAKVAEIAQAHAERDIYKARCEALETLLKVYANMVIDLQVRNTLLELKNG